MLSEVHKFTRYERLISGAPGGSRELRSVLAGASRAARLGNLYDTNEKQIVAEVASGVLGPLTTLYGWWILSEALRNNFKRLYFLARDGYIVKQVVEVLAKNWRIDIDLCYLHCSRESLLLPSVQEIDDFALSWITWGYLSSINIKEICRRLRIETQVLLHISGENFAIDSPLDAFALEKIKNILKSPEVSRIVVLHNEQLTRNLAGYLSSQRLNDGVPYAIVDTGWKGTSQYALSSFLAKIGARPESGITGFYLGLNRNSHIFNNDRTSAFLFNWNVNSIDYRLYYFLCFESLFSSKDGRTIGYLDEQSDFRPILDENLAKSNFWIIDIHHGLVKTYADHVSKVLPFSDYEKNAVAVARKVSREFISNPTVDEAKIYGDFIIAGEMTERDLQCLAPEMTYYDLMLMAIKKKKIKGFWPQGSMMRSAMNFARALYCFFLDTKLLDVYRRVFLKY